MKNKVLKTLGYIAGFMWIFSACCLDSLDNTWYYINIACGAYLALFSYANNWWEDYDEEKQYGKRKTGSKRESGTTLADSDTADGRNTRVRKGA